jgi:hypothetical protein
MPRAQTVSVGAEGGGQRAFTAETNAAFIVLRQAKGTTPARVAVRVDPSTLAAGKHEGRVTFKDASGASLALSVTLQIGDAQALAVRGEGCRLGEDGKLHALAGAGCVLSAAEGEAATVQWRLPGGEEVRGGRLYAQFVRRGEFQMLYSPDEGAADPLAVVIE